jgi:hypothetical protein
MPDTDRRFVMRVPAQSYLRFDRNDYSLDPRLVGRRVEVRVSQTEIAVVALDTGGSPAATRAGSPAASRSLTPTTRPRSTGCGVSAERAATSTSSCARSRAMTS